MNAKWTRCLPLVGLVALLAAGCSSGVGTDAQDCDYLMGVGISTGTTISPFTDVRCPVEHGMVFTTTVRVREPLPPVGTTVNDNFQLTHYTVRFVNRRNGGSVAGVDVPQPFSLNLPFEPQLVNSSVSGTSWNFTGFPVLLAAAKAQPPLSDANFFVQGQGGVDFDAVVTVFGHPVTSPDRACAGSFVYRFNVFDSGLAPVPGCQ